MKSLPGQAEDNARDALVVQLSAWSPRDWLGWLYVFAGTTLVANFLFADVLPRSSSAALYVLQIFVSLLLILIGIWRLSAARGITVNEGSMLLCRWACRRLLPLPPITLQVVSLAGALRAAWLPSPPRHGRLTGYSIRLEASEWHLQVADDLPEPRARAIAQCLAEHLALQQVDRGQRAVGAPTDVLRPRLQETLPLDPPQPPPGSALACSEIEGHLRIELPAHGLSRWGIAAIVLGVFFLWAFSVYLFRGGFERAAAGGAYGSVLFVTILLAVLPTLCLVVWPLLLARSRQVLILSQHYLQFSHTGILRRRTTPLLWEDVENIDIGPEAFGNGTVLRILAAGTGHEAAATASAPDREWLLSLLLHVVVNGYREGLATDFAQHPTFVTTALVAHARQDATPLAVRLRMRESPLPLAPPPDHVHSRVIVADDALEIETPPQGLHPVHFAVVGTAAVAGFLLGGWALLAVAPVALGIYYSATRRTAVRVESQAVKVRTTWRFGAREWRTDMDGLTAIDVRRSPWNLSAWLRGEGFALVARGPEGEVEFGHGLSRQELAWLRDQISRMIAYGKPDTATNALVVRRAPLLGNLLPPRGALTPQEYTAHLLEPAQSQRRFLVLELDKEPRAVELDQARRSTELTILGVIAAGMVPAGAYAAYLSLFEPGIASLLRLPLGIGLMGAVPGALLATFYRAALIVDRAGGVVMRAKTLLLPPALLPRGFLRHAAKQASVVPLEHMTAVVVREARDEEGAPYYTVTLDGQQPIVAKQLRAPEAARFYARELCRFTGLPMQDELNKDAERDEAAGL